jgi:hypothetical protein
VVRAQDPLTHRQQNSELVTGAGCIPGLSRPVGEVEADTQPNGVVVRGVAMAAVRIRCRILVSRGKITLPSVP